MTENRSLVVVLQDCEGEELCIHSFMGNQIKITVWGNTHELETSLTDAALNAVWVQEKVKQQNAT